ncbi:hypothetical protein [uncultured Hoeflea sp.]|uniref:hypothetical protein n=1 Tax=uncultured Hoeflea sp. TaxID=538666 RepID=UPI002622C61E|nr:hypothetical protein [uncultured Hoeflea sp.]
MTWKRAGTGLPAILGLSVLALSAAPETAAAETEPRYDRRIEEAAIRMLQPKLGTMRGALDLDPKRHLYPPLSHRIKPEDTTRWPGEASTSREGGSIIRY